MSFIMIINTDFIPFNLIYPVGSIYMSTVSANPSTYFGGTWERIQDRFLLGAGNTYNAGSTGGAASVQLQQSQMPTSVPIVRATANGEWSCGIWGNYGGGYGINLPGQNGWGGQGQSHNNMPPYLTVYIWKRTA